MGVEMGLGFLLSLIAFLRAELGGRWAKEEILRVLADAKTVQAYLEWLRRRDQQDLIREIESSKGDLLRGLAEIGTQLDEFATAVRAKAGEIEQRIRELNERVIPPILSPVSLPSRPRLSTTLRGRDRELQWLLDNERDALVVGQPGAGKTELLHSLAQAKDAKFLLSDNPDIAAAALLAGPPSIVLVDDAGLRASLILRLRHLRIEQRLDFQIVAVCWPFEKDELQQTLQITEESVLSLEGLPRPVIAEIIKNVTTTQHVSVSDQFIRVVAKQARGKPGLAASLSLATIESSGEALLSGELLLRDLGPFLRRVTGTEGIHLLSAFACGGKIGLPVASVAKQIGKSIVEVSVDAQRIALAGVLEQTGKETLSVQPSFLRSALIKTTFFPTSGVALSWDICKALIESANDPVVGYLELVSARGLAGAAINDDLLRTLATQLDDLRFWEALAELDRRNCNWVLETKGAISPGIKRAALRYHPEAIIPEMLKTAALEKRPLNIIPNADMRILQDWIVSGSGADAIKRRRTLFDAAATFLQKNESAPTALEAIRSVFSLNHHETDSDPADPRTIRFRDSLLGLQSAKEVFEMWKPFLEAAKKLPAFPWPGIPALVENWIRSDTRRGSGLPPEYVEFLRSSSREMILQLIPLASDHQAALRWLYLLSKKLGIDTGQIRVSEEFMTLYPEERLEGDWQKREEEQNVRVIDLAKRWQDRPFAEIVQTIHEWENQADDLGRVWPRKAFILCGRLAELVRPTGEELSLAIADLPPMALRPFLEAALADKRLSPAHFEACLKRQDLTGILIEFTLKGLTRDLYDALKPRLPTWVGLVEGICLRNEVSEELLQRLLRHDDQRLRFETALYMFRSKSKEGIPKSIFDLWRTTIVQGLAAIAGTDQGEAPYDLRELLASHPAIGPEVLDQLISSGLQFHGFVAAGMIHLLVARLEKEEKRKLLRRCTHLVYSPLPRLLVGSDQDLYRELLSIAELRNFHLAVLSGDPNEANWVDLAKLALAAGFSHRDVAHAVESSSFSWTGGLSTYYQEWVERFERLRQHNDADIQKIADEGLKSFIALRNQERKIEHQEEVHGWD